MDNLFLYEAGLMIAFSVIVIFSFIQQQRKICDLEKEIKEHKEDYVIGIVSNIGFGGYISTKTITKKMIVDEVGESIKIKGLGFLGDPQWYNKKDVFLFEDLLKKNKRISHKKIK